MPAGLVSTEVYASQDEGGAFFVFFFVVHLQAAAPISLAVYQADGVTRALTTARTADPDVVVVRAL